MIERPAILAEGHADLCDAVLALGLQPAQRRGARGPGRAARGAAARPRRRGACVHYDGGPVRRGRATVVRVGQPHISPRSGARPDLQPRRDPAASGTVCRTTATHRSPATDSPPHGSEDRGPHEEPAAWSATCLAGRTCGSEKGQQDEENRARHGDGGDRRRSRPGSGPDRALVRGYPGRAVGCRTEERRTSATTATSIEARARATSHGTIPASTGPTGHSSRCS